MLEYTQFKANMVINCVSPHETTRGDTLFLSIFWAYSIVVSGQGEICPYNMWDWYVHNSACEQH